ncbi:hypothetical protein HRV97_12120 [Sphingomonas sp. HHU CXW]|uniref:VUT family protein n=1 Tax=Sphingomonas hominis TaxID=2741495 RepID=A0ABX2JQ07_9SPHN|nr:hypothetical protein [Sphingomonas hominis]NTS65905.1 hypothetical protein [Sphingomonas hominis]
MSASNSATRDIAWPLTLAAATILGTLATACMMPFVGLAVVAAATMRKPAMLVTIVGAWAANQLLGFGLLGYPLEGYALAWGVALGAASVAAGLLARAAFAESVTLPRALAVFAAAFVLDEALLYAFALAVGGTATFTPAIVLRLFANDALWCGVLAGLHVVLTRAAPRWYAAAPRAA